MSNWEKVTQDKELLSKVEDWVRGLSIDSPQEVFDEMNRLTGNDWSREQYESHIFDYPDFYDMEEVVYALFHEGKYPMRTREDIFAWNIEQAVEDDKSVCTFFIRGAYKKNKEKSNLYTSVDVKGLYQELLGAFPEWNEDADSYENLFCLKNQEVYGFEKSIYIQNVYDRKFLDCTLTNMNQEEKDTFVNVVRKYCNHVVREKIHPHNTATYKMKFMFDWRSGVCLWADNEAAKSKFNGSPVETCDLPISDGLKATLEDLIYLYDEAFDFEESNGDLLWDKNQIEEFLCTAREAYACLCEELGPEYEVELGLDDFEDAFKKETKKGDLIPMNRNDYLRELPNQKIDETKVKQVEEVYGCTLPEEVQRIISNCDETIFFDDDCRVLSFDEILEAPETLCELFAENKMIPLFDCMDNDFIVYKADSHKWLMFNTEDEMDFDEAEYLADLWEEEDEGDYSITSIKTVSGSEPSNEQANSRISITLEDGEINIQGTINLGYIGTFTDEEIEIDDTLEEIREWDIVQDNLDEDCTDEELIAFLNKYFNEFADKITRNIDNINGTFLLQTLTDMDCNEIDFMVIDELFLEDKLPYGNEEDIAELYNFAHDGLRSLIPYLESPNDGCIPKGHIEALLRSFYPAFDFDCFIANIVPEVLTLCDGSIAFQCSDAFDEAILCGAYAELDEELSFKDWHNF